MKSEKYRGKVPLEDIQKDYFLYFNHNYWMHKAHALLSFINEPSDINKLKFDGDKDSDQTILDNLKMELHMMVFHSSETLFLNVFSIVYMPNLPWIWISRCKSTLLYDLIKVIKDKGLSTLQESPETWLRDNLFPYIKEDNVNYEKSILSSVFVKKYLEVLSHEYLDHNDYNSYKHGLRSFVGSGRLQVFDNTTSEKIVDMEGDTIYYLEFEEKDHDGKKHLDNRQPYVLVKRTNKGFDYMRDYRIIMMNSAILTNFFYAKKVSIKTASENSRTIGYYLLDDWNVDEIFNFGSKGVRDVFKRFTV